MVFELFFVGLIAFCIAPQDYKSSGAGVDWKDTPKTENKQLQLFAELDEQEQKIVALLKESQEVSLDVLAIKTEIPVRLMSGILLGLELKGVVKALPGKRFGL